MSRSGASTPSEFMRTQHPSSYAFQLMKPLTMHRRHTCYGTSPPEPVRHREIGTNISTAGNIQCTLSNRQETWNCRWHLSR
ncbi:protein of unknown function (plasmid) [Cupriavidus taiwanensis]|nr:protein of unknown function [Cupriavidus taiwanensis]SPA57219.1 protein of unknown function [Cupriavidus taiwanensis]